MIHYTIIPHYALAIKLIVWQEYYGPNTEDIKWDNAHRFIKFPTQYMVLLGHALQLKPLNWKIFNYNNAELFPKEDEVPELYSINLFNQ